MLSVVVYSVDSTGRAGSLFDDLYDLELEC